MEPRPIIMPEHPRCVYIEVTNTCNLLCQTCPITFRDLEAREVLSYDKFLAIVGQFPRDARPPVISKVDPDAAAIFAFSVSAPRGKVGLRYTQAAILVPTAPLAWRTA